MRSALSIVALSGCLAAPADPPADPAVGADASVFQPGCASGSTLDLVYVDAMTILPSGSTTQVNGDGFAVFANPSEDTVLLADLAFDLVATAPGTQVSVTMDGGEGLLQLGPGEAKGVLGEEESAVVRGALTETWADTTRPELATVFQVIDSRELEWVAEGQGAIGLQVRAGDYLFSIEVTLVVDRESPEGTPLSAARATATCP